MPCFSQFSGNHQAAKSLSVGVIEFILLKMASLASKAKIDCLSTNLIEQEVVHRNFQARCVKTLFLSVCTHMSIHRASRCAQVVDVLSQIIA